MAWRALMSHTLIPNTYDWILISLDWIPWYLGWICRFLDQILRYLGRILRFLEWILRNLDWILWYIGWIWRFLRQRGKFAPAANFFLIKLLGLTLIGNIPGVLWASFLENLSKKKFIADYDVTVQGWVMTSHATVRWSVGTPSQGMTSHHWRHV